MGDKYTTFQGISQMEPVPLPEPEPFKVPDAVKDILWSIQGNGDAHCVDLLLYLIEMIRETACEGSSYRGGQRTCHECGYEGEFGTLGCACYDEWAAACTPESPGPGCSNGRPCCPACGGDASGPAVGWADVLMTMEKAVEGLSPAPEEKS